MITETLSNLLAFFRATRIERGDGFFARRQSERRVARLQTLDLATLRAEHANWTVLKFLFDGIRDRTAGESAGVESLQRRVDEHIAEFERRKEQS